MKKRFQIWQKIIYKDEKKYKFWSLQVRGEGDETLPEESSPKDWVKVVVLNPVGSPKTTFSMGFSDFFGNVKVSSATRKVEDGLFGMKLGKEDCHFFIVSRDGPVSLEFVGHTTTNAATIALY